MATCQAWRDDDDGNAIQTDGVCDAEAKWISCVPFVGAHTCDEHKCRCATPIGVIVVKPTDVRDTCSVCGIKDGEVERLRSGLEGCRFKVGRELDEHIDRVLAG